MPAREKVDTEIRTKRRYSIRKRNDFVRQAKYSLTAQQVKVLSLVFSKIQPDDTELKTYEITVKEYCELCGIDYDNGGNYAHIKQTLQELSDESFWVHDEKEDADILVRWIDKPRIRRSDGTIRFCLDKYIQQYVIGITRNFVDYPFLMILPMKSVYAMRIYELLKSVSYQKGCIYDIDELKQLLFGKDKKGKWVDIYPNFKDFRINVLEPAQKEINTYTDLIIAWTPIYEGRKVRQVKFSVKTKTPGQLMAAMRACEDKLNRKRRRPRQLEGQPEAAGQAGEEAGQPETATGKR